MDINLAVISQNQKTPVRSHLARLFDSPSPQPSPSTWWPGSSLGTTSSRKSEKMEMKMENDTLAPTTPARLLKLPLSSTSPKLEEECNATGSEVHDFALDEGHHSGASSPFDSDPEDEEPKLNLDASFSSRLNTILSPVIEQPEDPINSQPEFASNSPSNTFGASTHSRTEIADMESDLIQLENELSADISSAAENDNSSIKTDSTTLVNDTAESAHEHDLPTAVMPSEQNEPDLVDFVSPGVTISEEELGADSADEGIDEAGRAGVTITEEELSAGSDDETDQAGLAKESLKTDDEDEKTVEKSLSAETTLHHQNADQAYGDPDELAVIMEEEEETPCPTHPSYPNVAALIHEETKGEQLSDDHEHDQSQFGSEDNDAAHHNERERFDSAVCDGDGDAVLHEKSGSLHYNELPTQEVLKRYLATLQLPAKSSEDAVAGDIDLDHGAATSGNVHNQDENSVTEAGSSKDNHEERKLSVVVPPEQLCFTVESAMTPRDESWIMKSPTEEQRLGLSLEAMQDAFLETASAVDDDERRPAHLNVPFNTPEIGRIGQQQQPIGEIMAQWALEYPARDDYCPSAEVDDFEETALEAHNTSADEAEPKLKPAKDVNAVQRLPSPAGWWEITLIPAWLPSPDILSRSRSTSPTKEAKRSLKSPRNDRYWKKDKSKHRNRPYQRPVPSLDISDEDRAKINKWNQSLEAQSPEKAAHKAGQAEDHDKRAAVTDNQDTLPPVYHETFKRTVSGEKLGQRRVVSVSHSTHTPDLSPPEGQKNKNNENVPMDTTTEQPKAAPIILPPVRAPVLPEAEYDPWPVGLEEAVLSRVSFASPQRSTFESVGNSASSSPVRTNPGSASNSPRLPRSPAASGSSASRNRRPSPPRKPQVDENAVRAASDLEDEDPGNVSDSLSSMPNLSEDQEEEDDEPLLSPPTPPSKNARKHTASTSSKRAVSNFKKYSIYAVLVIVLVWLAMSDSARRIVGMIRGYEVEYDEGKARVMWRFGVRE